MGVSNLPPGGQLTTAAERSLIISNTLVLDENTVVFPDNDAMTNTEE